MRAPPSSAAPPSGRRAALLGWLVLAGGFLLTVSASRVIGPAFDEERRINVARHATDVARAVTNLGPSALVSPASRAIFDELVPFGVLPGLLSGWLGEVLAGANIVDRLTAARFGWLLITGLAPAALYWIVERSRGPRVAALAACILFAMPRWIYGAAAAREPVVVASLWLFILAAYLRSLPPSIETRRAGVRSRFRWAGPVFAVMLGLGIATDLAVLCVVPVIVVHYWGVRGRAAWRALRRGRAPLPSAFLWAIVIAPVALLLAAPPLWRGAASAAEWLFAPLAPSVDPVLYRGTLVASVRDVQGSYALNWLLVTAPVGLLLAALAGAIFIGLERRNVRRGTRAPDPFRLGLLVLLVLVAVVLGPSVTPPVLTRFPPRAEIALPFLAVLGAVAVGDLATRIIGARVGSWLVLAAGVTLLTSALFGLPTAASYFGLLGGSTPRIVQNRMWTVGDGSEVALLAPAIDKLGAPHAAVDSHDVPRSYWNLLNQVGRMRTRIDTGRGPPGSLVLTRGPHDGAIAVVERGGAILWSLSRR